MATFALRPDNASISLPIRPLSKSTSARKLMPRSLSHEFGSGGLSNKLFPELIEPLAEHADAWGTLGTTLDMPQGSSWSFSDHAFNIITNADPSLTDAESDGVEDLFAPLTSDMAVARVPMEGEAILKRGREEEEDESVGYPLKYSMGCSGRRVSSAIMSASFCRTLEIPLPKKKDEAEGQDFIQDHSPIVREIDNEKYNVGLALDKHIDSLVSMDEDTEVLDADDLAEEDQEDAESSESEAEEESSDKTEQKSAENANDVTNVQPMDRKPKFDFAALKSNSSLMSRLPGFLAQMEASNRELEAEKAAGTIAARRLEIDDNEEGAKSEQYIEMNLGLGVLEEKTGDSDTSSEGESSDDEDIMDKLMGTDKDNTEEVDKKKSGIQEL